MPVTMSAHGPSSELQPHAYASSSTSQAPTTNDNVVTILSANQTADTFVASTAALHVFPEYDDNEQSLFFRQTMDDCRDLLLRKNLPITKPTGLGLNGKVGRFKAVGCASNPPTNRVFMQTHANGAISRLTRSPAGRQYRAARNGRNSVRPRPDSIRQVGTMNCVGIC
jgi:hypothetical protein